MAAATVGPSIPEFSDHSIKLHRNLMAFSSFYLAVIYFGVNIGTAKIFEIEIGQIGGKSFHVILAVFIAYHLVAYWLSAAGDLSRRHWSEVRNYSNNFQDHLQSLGSFFEGLGPNPDNVDARWEQMEKIVGMIRENLRVVPVSFNFFAGMASLRLWFDFIGANVLAAGAIITAIVQISG